MGWCSALFFTLWITQFHAVLSVEYSTPLRFEVHKSKVTWNEASSICLATGGKLAEPRTRSLTKAIDEAGAWLAYNKPGKGVRIVPAYWIGVIHTEEGFVYASQCDNFPARCQSYAQVKEILHTAQDAQCVAGGPRLRSARCDVHIGFVCQIVPNDMPRCSMTVKENFGMEHHTHNAHTYKTKSSVETIAKCADICRTGHDCIRECWAWAWETQENTTCWLYFSENPYSFGYTVKRQGSTFGVKICFTAILHEDMRLSNTPSALLSCPAKCVPPTECPTEIIANPESPSGFQAGKTNIESENNQNIRGPPRDVKEAPAPVASDRICLACPTLKPCNCAMGPSPTDPPMCPTCPPVETTQCPPVIDCDSCAIEAETTCPTCSSVKATTCTPDVPSSLHCSTCFNDITSVPKIAETDPQFKDTVPQNDTKPTTMESFETDCSHCPLPDNYCSDCPTKCDECPPDCMLCKICNDYGFDCVLNRKAKRSVESENIMSNSKVKRYVETERTMGNSKGKRSVESEKLMSNRNGKRSVESGSTMGNRNGKRSVESENLMSNRKGKISVESESTKSNSKGKRSVESENLMSNRKGKRSVESHNTILTEIEGEGPGVMKDMEQGLITTTAVNKVGNASYECASLTTAQSTTNVGDIFGKCFDESEQSSESKISSNKSVYNLDFIHHQEIVKFTEMIISTSDCTLIPLTPPCECKEPPKTNLSLPQQEIFINTLLEHMVIVKKNKSSLASIRRYTSANDDRPSSRNIGMIGIAILVVLSILLLAVDFNHLRQDVTVFVHNLRCMVRRRNDFRLLGHDN